MYIDPTTPPKAIQVHQDVDKNVSDAFRMVSKILEAMHLAIANVVNSISDTVFGIGQTWQNVTGSRAGSTTYTNTSSRPIMVSIWCNNTATVGGTGHQFLVDGVVIAQQLYAGAGLASNNASSGTVCIVPAGSTYSAAIINATLAGWMEFK